MKKIFTSLFFTISLLLPFSIFADNLALQTSSELIETINQQGQLGIINLTSMEFSGNYKGENPPETILDGDIDSFYSLKEGADSAWVKLNFEDPVYLFEMELDAYIPDDAEFLLQTEIDNELITLPASHVPGESFGTVLDLSKDALLVDNLLLKIYGDNLTSFILNEVRFYAKDENFILHKKTLIPETFFTNRAQLNTDFILVDGKIGTQWNNLNQGINAVLRWLNQQRDVTSSVEPRNHNKLGDEIYFRLHQPGPLEFVKFYCTEESRGEMTLSVFSEDRWTELNTYNLDNLDGWEEIDLSHLGNIEHIMIALEDPSQPWNIGSYGGIGEIEVWAKESPETVQLIDLISPTTEFDSSAIFALDSPKELQYSIQMVLAGDSMDGPVPVLNGHTLVDNKAIAYDGFILYEFPFPSHFLNEDSNLFLAGSTDSTELLSAHLLSEIQGSLEFNSFTELNDDKKYSGNPLSNDPQFLSLLEGEADMEEILLYFRNHAPELIYLGNDGIWDFKDTNTITEREAKITEEQFLDSLRIDQPGDLQEVVIAGSPNEIVNPYIEILFPTDDMVLPQYVTHNYKVVGITDSPAGVIEINGLPVQIEDNFFWLEMRDLQTTEPGQHLIESSIVLENGNTSSDSVRLSIESDSHHLFLDQEDQLYTQSNNSFALTGKVTGNASELYIDNQEIPLSRNGRFVSEVSLNRGLNVIDIELRDPVTHRVLLRETRRVVLLWGNAMLQILSPEDGSLCLDNSVEVRGLVSPWGLKSLLVNGNAAEINGNIFHIELNNLAEIHNRISVVAEYDDGLTLEKEVWVSKDTDAPLLSNILPENGTMVATYDVVVSGVIEDSNDVSVFVNGKSARISGSQFSCITPLSLEGNNSIRIQARDIAGRVSTWPEFYVFRDTTPPEPFEVEVIPSTYTNERRPRIEFASTDAASGLSHFEVSVSNYGFSQQVSPYLLPYLDEEDNLIVVRAYDVLGNYRDSSVNITIDTQAPDNVQNFRAVPGLDKMYLRWDEDDDETAYYVINSSQISNEVIVKREESVEQENGLLSFEYKIKELDENQEYSFSIYAVDRAGNIGAINRCTAVTGYNEIVLEHDDLNILEYENIDLYFTEGTAGEEIDSIIIREVKDEYVEDQSLNPILSPVYSFSVDTVEGELDHVYFEKPFVGEFSYKDLYIPETLDEKQLAVFYFDEDWGRWFRTEENIVNTESKTIAFSSDHFSMYSVQPTISEFGNINSFADIGGYARSNSTQHAPVTVSPQSGTAKTSMTEFVLPGIAGLDLEIRRTYDTLTADMDSNWDPLNIPGPPVDFSPVGPDFQNGRSEFINVGASNDSESNNLYGTTSWVFEGSGVTPQTVEDIEETLGSAWDSPDSWIESLQRNRMLTQADHRFALGQGWRLDFPYLKYTDQGVLIRTPEGNFISSQNLKRHKAEDTGHLFLEDTLTGGYTVDINRRRISGEQVHYQVTNVIMTSYDGKKYTFDDSGYLLSITDPYDNSIEFNYKDTQLKYINDSLGRQVIFNYDENYHFISDIYAFGSIKLNSFDAELTNEIIEDAYYHVHYDYTSILNFVSSFPLLQKSEDVQGREWNYEYSPILLETHYNDNSNYYPNNIKSHYVFPLKSASGPGIGFSEVSYNAISQPIYKPLTTMEWGLKLPVSHVLLNSWDDVARDRVQELAANSVTLYETAADSNFKKLTTFEYRINREGRIVQSTVDDGRLKQIFSYSEKDFEVDNPNSSSLLGLLTHKHIVKIPQYTLTRVQKYTYNGTREILEEDKRYYYSKHQMLPTRTELKWGASLDPYSITNTYQYDRWRNITQISHTEETGDSIKSRITYNWFENEDTVSNVYSQYSLQHSNPIEADKPVRDFSTFGIHNRLHHSLTVYSDSEEMDEVSLGSSVYYRYDEAGRLIETKDLRVYDEILPVDEDWSTDSFKYNDLGELSSHTNSTNGETRYVRDYSQSPFTVSVSRTVDILDGNVDGTEVSTTYEIDSVSGNVLSSTLPGDIISLFSYDKLGRIVSIKKPSTTYIPTTNTDSYILMEYGDSLDNLYSVRVNSDDQVQLLKYNNHGEISSIREYSNQNFNLNSSDLFDSIKNLSPYRTTSVEPDYYGNIGKIVYPNNSETSFSYDGLGRLLSKNYTEEGNPRTVTYRYSSRNRSMERINELGNRVVQYRDAAGNITKIEELDRGSYSLRSQKFTYNALGEMVSSEDALGNVREYTYNLWGQLNEVKLPAADYFVDNSLLTGQILTIERNYNALGLLSEQQINVDEISYSRSSYEYDDFGLLIKQMQHYTESNRNHYSLYNNEELLISNGVKTSETEFKYNNLRQLVRVIDPADNEWNRSYTRRGQISRISTPDDDYISYKYDTMDRVTQINDARQNKSSYDDYNGITNYEYDSFGRLNRVLMPYIGNDPNQRPAYSISYDEMDNVTQIDNPDLTYMLFSYTDHNQWLESKTYGSTIPGEGKTYTSTYQYDEVGNVSNITLPGDGTLQQSFTYDPLGRRISASFPGDIENHFGYDANNNLTWVQDGRGYRQYIEYDSLNRADKVIDANGQEWEYAYHPLGGVSKTTDPMDTTHSYQYDERGLIFEEENGRGMKDYYSYNAMGQLATHLDPRGTQSHFEYNDSGMLEEVNFYNDTKSHTVSYDYDEMGALKSATDGFVTSKYNDINGQYAPDPNGLIRNLQTQVTGGSYNSNVGYEYDIMNRLTSIQNGEGVSDRINYQYDALGQLSDIFKNEKLPGISGFNSDDNSYFFTNAAYNDKGLLSSYDLANNIRVSKIYDERRRLEFFTYTHINEGIVKDYTFVYDKADNIIQKNQNYYGYDGRNQMVTAMLSDASVPGGEEPIDEFEINAALNDILSQRIVAEDLPKSVELSDWKLDWGAQSIAADLGYPALVSSVEINVEKVEDIDRINESNLVVYTSMSNYEYAYDMMEIEDFTIDLAENEEGNLSGVIRIELANPVLSRYIKIHSHYNDRMFDYAANRSHATVQLAPVTPLSVYKKLGSGRNEFYSYNNKGNRDSSSFMGTEDGSYNYEYYLNSDLLKTDGIYDYKYDENGNLIEKGKNYTINDDDIKVDQGGIYWYYHYDLLNRLSSVDKLQDDDTLTTVATYTYDAHGYRIQKDSGGETTQYVFDLMGNVIEEIAPDGKSTRFVYAGRTMISQINHDGSVYAVGTDHLGSTTFLVDEEGKTVWESEMSPFGDQEEKGGFFTSKQWDEDIELYYFNARWYDPETGRFITEDPIRDGTGWYSYVGNNPMGFVDPTGLEKDPSGGSDGTNKSGKTVKGAPDPGIGNGDTKMDLETTVYALCRDYEKRNNLKKGSVKHRTVMNYNNLNDKTVTEMVENQDVFFSPEMGEKSTTSPTKGEIRDSRSGNGEKGKNKGSSDPPQPPSPSDPVPDPNIDDRQVYSIGKSFSTNTVGSGQATGFGLYFVPKEDSLSYKYLVSLYAACIASPLPNKYYLLAAIIALSDEVGVYGAPAVALPATGVFGSMKGVPEDMRFFNIGGTIEAGIWNNKASFLGGFAEIGISVPVVKTPIMDVGGAFNVVSSLDGNISGKTAEFGVSLGRGSSAYSRIGATVATPMYKNGEFLF